ncbi:hypothetical protein [Undibacterium sp. CY21W]|uniref:hypothetical protein n=1 Tax=Undibacterium sp. CY21W TaxID=2762293 RepID=UPI00164B9549|nr:hypothetical protein [Undibacterium sp. CY21W]MBC3927770.1 hypothetical protein [Undibacterium sp. CY21W]
MTLLTAIPNEMPGRNQDEDKFVRLMDQLFVALPGFQSQLNSIIGEINALVVDANESKTAAEGFLAAIIVYATNAANSASAAALSTNVTKWVTGITYVSSDIGRVVWSPTDFQNYRLMIAGTSTIDPNLEDGIGSPRMWRKINYEKPALVVSANTATLSTDKIAANSTNGSFTITAPSNPVAGETWFEVFDYAGTFAKNNVTVNFNGGKFEGVTGDTFILDMNNLDIKFRYIDTLKGWVAR